MIALQVYGSDVLSTGGHERVVKILSKKLSEHGIKVFIAHMSKSITLKAVNVYTLKV